MSARFEDLNWPRASAWLGGDHLPDAVRQLAILGAPARLGSITPGRSDLAPSAIRAALSRYSTFDVEHGSELRELIARDFGDLAGIKDLTPEQAFDPIQEALRSALDNCEAAVLLGGDNSITRPGCHALGSPRNCGLLTLDAHLDLRDLDKGLTNGNPVRALLNDGMPGSHIVQVGIQSYANSKAYHAVARKAGIQVIPADQVFAAGIEAVVSEALARISSSVESIYFDLDLDVLDRSFAPATPGSRPGGLAPWQILRAARICGLHPKVRVMDLVEIDPEKDIADATCMAAAACLLSFASGLRERLKAG